MRTIIIAQQCPDGWLVAPGTLLPRRQAGVVGGEPGLRRLKRWQREEDEKHRVDDTARGDEHNGLARVFARDAVEHRTHAQHKRAPGLVAWRL